VLTAWGAGVLLNAGSGCGRPGQDSNLDPHVPRVAVRDQGLRRGRPRSPSHPSDQRLSSLSTAAIRASPTCLIHQYHVGCRTAGKGLVRGPWPHGSHLPADCLAPVTPWPPENNLPADRHPPFAVGMTAMLREQRLLGLSSQ